jgi:hypothetical protein
MQKWAAMRHGIGVVDMWSAILKQVQPPISMEK